MATFGYTTAGSAWEGSSNNYKQGSIAILSEAATAVSKMTGYVRNNDGSARYCRMAIYADSSGTPGALVAQTNQVQLAASASAAWVDFTFASSFSLSAGTYWLTFGADSDGPRVAYDWVEGAWRGRYAPDTYSDGFSDPYGTSYDNGSLRDSMYVTYTTAAASIGQVNIGDVWKTATAAQINIGDSWKPVTGIKVNIGDSWKVVL